MLCRAFVCSGTEGSGVKCFLEESPFLLRFLLEIGKSILPKRPGATIMEG